MVLRSSYAFFHFVKILITSPNFCQTKQGINCTFPFVYYGNKYSSCTKDFSTNGEAWCATNVTKNGLVLYSNFEDCMPDCFEGDFYVEKKIRMLFFLVSNDFFE